MSTSQNSSSSSEPVAAAGGSFMWLMDVTCAVDVVLGSCAVKVRECFAFERGTVVPLTQAAGADLELRAGGVPLAQGEVVVLDDRAHLRINRILAPSDLEAA